MGNDEPIWTERTWGVHLIFLNNFLFLFNVIGLDTRLIYVGDAENEEGFGLVTSIM